MSKKIRVLLATGTLRGGGSERQIIHLLHHLDRQQFSPLLYVVYPEGELSQEVPVDVPVFRFWDGNWTPRWNYPGRIHRRQVADLARVLRDEQVHLVCDRTYFMTLITAAACRKRHVPRISVIVSDPARNLTNQAERFFWLKRRLLGKAYRSADRVVAVSAGVRDAARSYYGLAEAHITVANSLLDVQAVERQAQATTPTWPFPPDESALRIVTIARLQAEKGVHLLLAAVAQLVRDHELPVQLCVCGDGRQRTELQQQVSQLGVEANVKWLGYVPNPLPLLRQAHVYCLSSLFEGMPNVLLEAMACAVPIVATDCSSGPAELLANSRGKLVPVGDSRAIASGLYEVYNNYAEFEKRAQESLEYVRQHHDARHAIVQWQALMQSVLR